MRTLFVLGGVLLVGACEHYEENVDAVLAGHRAAAREVGPPSTLLPHAATVGQWVLYRETEHGETVGYQLVSITQESCGSAIEYVWGRADHRTISKACYSQLPDLATDPASWTELVVAAVTETDADPPLVIDMRPGRNLRSRTRLDLDRFHLNFDGARWRHDDMPRQDVDVPAGHFAKTIRATNRTQTVTTWFHPAVPITAMVRSQTRDGLDVELVTFGDAGARTLLADVPGPGTYIECMEQIMVGSHLEKLECLHHDRNAGDEAQRDDWFRHVLRGHDAHKTSSMGNGKQSGPR